MTGNFAAKLTASFGAALCVFALAAASPDDDTPKNANADQAMPERSYENIPSNWEALFLDEETRETHRGDKVKKVCLDEDFQQMPQVYKTVRQKTFNDPTLKERRFTRVKRLQGGQDFMVIDQNHLVLSMPLAGNYLIETRRCKKNLDRAKYISFTDEIDRRSVNRCIRNRGGISIQTRQKSGFKGCEVRGIYEWDGPLPLDDQISDADLPPIELK